MGIQNVSSNNSSIQSANRKLYEGATKEEIKKRRSNNLNMHFELADLDKNNVLDKFEIIRYDLITKNGMSDEQQRCKKAIDILKQNNNLTKEDKVLIQKYEKILAEITTATDSNKQKLLRELNIKEDDLSDNWPNMKLIFDQYAHLHSTDSKLRIDMNINVATDKNAYQTADLDKNNNLDAFEIFRYNIKTLYPEKSEIEVMQEALKAYKYASVKFLHRSEKEVNYNIELIHYYEQVIKDIEKNPKKAQQLFQNNIKNKDVQSSTTFKALDLNGDKELSIDEMNNFEKYLKLKDENYKKHQQLDDAKWNANKPLFAGGISGIIVGITGIITGNKIMKGIYNATKGSPNWFNKTFFKKVVTEHFATATTKNHCMGDYLYSTSKIVGTPLKNKLVLTGGVLLAGLAGYGIYKLVSKLSSKKEAKQEIEKLSAELEKEDAQIKKLDAQYKSLNVQNETIQKIKEQIPDNYTMDDALKTIGIANLIFMMMDDDLKRQKEKEMEHKSSWRSVEDGGSGYRRSVEDGGSGYRRSTEDGGSSYRRSVEDGGSGYGRSNEETGYKSSTGWEG